MSDYKYKGIPLSPGIVEEIIVLLFDKKRVSRDEIVTSVLEYHRKQGGAEPKSANFPASVKKALQNLARKENANNIKQGYWEISMANDNSEKDLNHEKLPAISTYSEVPQNYVPEKLPNELDVRYKFGEGNSSVYLYYFDSYKELAESKKQSSWACKIGMSDRHPETRILSQFGTSLPEKPTVDFIMYTDNAPLIESIIHSILKIRGSVRTEAPGKEWFNTNPEEVLSIISFLEDK
ncbi:GIY-YIG nuclease family protein [Alkalicoccus luteus]|uniref:GIY-YIG nuclease family protein n=1 Tax=Alkalicoccus luteus TaxID=1237094 RepID=A0A969PPG5_9BACI|nr:GIY-YIG nuclease family protein [Alkalicoccus luteus]NJP37976.1 GIY-YIG nuclease family protein [Alkalicoccus luteus]